MLHNNRYKNLKAIQWNKLYFQKSLIFKYGGQKLPYLFFDTFFTLILLALIID